MLRILLPALGMVVLSGCGSSSITLPSTDLTSSTSSTSVYVFDNHVNDLQVSQGNVTRTQFDGTSLETTLTPFVALQTTSTGRDNDVFDIVADAFKSSSCRGESFSLCFTNGKATINSFETEVIQTILPGKAQMITFKISSPAVTHSTVQYGDEGQGVNAFVAITPTLGSLPTGDVIYNGSMYIVPVELSPDGNDVDDPGEMKLTVDFSVNTATMKGTFDLDEYPDSPEYLTIYNSGPLGISRIDGVLTGDGTGTLTIPAGPGSAPDIDMTIRNISLRGQFGGQNGGGVAGVIYTDHEANTDIDPPLFNVNISVIGFSPNADVELS